MKVILTVVPMAGHVGPVTGLVAELVERGHDVRVYTGSRYRQRFTDLGASVVTWSQARDFDEDDLAASFGPGARKPGVRRGIALVNQGFIGTAPGQVQDLRAELERDPADVLVADSMSFGGVFAGELLGLPWALLNVLPFNVTVAGPPPGFRVRPAKGVIGRQRDRLLWLLYRASTSPFHRAYNRARAAAGLAHDPRPYGNGLFSDWLVLATGCPTLQAPWLDLPEQLHFVGQLQPAATAPPAVTAAAQPARPLVVVTQGTSDLDYADLIQPALAGLADLDVDVIATSGLRGRTDVGITPPANARVVDFADFATLLPTASAFVTNGGWGGVLASLAAGVPPVVAARGAADKPEIGRRVAGSGAGIDLRTGRPQAGAVATAVRKVLADPSYIARARQIGAELQQQGGRSAAADLVERLAETRAPVRAGRL